MASVTINISGLELTNFFSSIQWDLFGNAISLGNTLSANPSQTLYLVIFDLPRTIDRNFVRIRLAFSPTGSSTTAGPEFSTQMEQNGTITIEAGDGSTITLIGIEDSTEPYEWELSEPLLTSVREFAENLVGLSGTDRNCVFTFNDTPATAPSFTDDTGDDQSWVTGTAITDIIVPEADGDSTPTYSVVGSLPAGIAFNTTSRVISGTPTTVGSGTITIRATNSEGDDDWTVDYTTTAPLVAPSFADDTGDAQAWSQNIEITPIVVPEAVGNPTPIYEVQGSLPNGIGFTVASRIIVGTPTSVGSGTITIRATNSEGFDDWTVDYATTVVSATIIDSQITSTPLLDPDNTGVPNTYGLGEVIEFTVTYDTAVDVTGMPQFPMNFGQSPTGSPEYADYAGGDGTTEITFEWVVAATDEDDNGIFFYGSTDSQLRGEILLNGGAIRNAGTTVDADLTTLNRGTKSDHRVDGSLVGGDVAPVFVDDTGDAQNWTVGTAIANITVPLATGSPTPTYAVVGTLPDGLSFDAGTRVISGTPTTVGSGTITIRATNTEGMDDWTIDYVTTGPLVAPSFTDDTGDAQSWNVGIAIAEITVPIASGNPVPTYAVLGTLPAGISFNTNSRIISGSPTTAGSGTITIRAINSEGFDDWIVDYAASVVLVSPLFTDDTGNAQSWIVGTAITPIIVPEATGNPTPTYTVVGTLTAGILFDTTSRVISGTPTSVSSGTITISATNSEGVDNWMVDYATVAPNTAPSASAGPDQSLNTGVEVTLDGSASSDAEDAIGDLTFAWSQISGTVVVLSDTSAQQPTFINPNDAGTLVFRLTVTDTGGLTDADDVSITVQNQAPVVVINTNDIVANTAATINFDATVTDPDDDLVDLTILWTANPNVGSFVDNSVVNVQWTPPTATDSDQVINLILRATDPDGLFNADTVRITISAITVVPFTEIAQPALAGTLRLKHVINVKERILDHIPAFYSESKIINDLYDAIAPEFELLLNYVSTPDYNTENIDGDIKREIDEHINKTIGWGFERLINQLFVVSANDLLGDYVRLYGTSLESNYIRLRNKLLFYSSLNRANNQYELQQELDLIGTNLIHDIDILYSEYTIIITLNPLTDEEILLITQRQFNRILPAHILITISTTNLTLNNSPQGTLNDIFSYTIS